jgi:protein-disulfide isomerase
VVTVFRHFPLNIHPNAVPAAKAAYCAGQQAPKWFWAMHDWLFASQSSWAGASAANAATQFRQQALAFGADATKYDDCMKDSRTEARVQQDFQDGSKQGVRGTPAFFLNTIDAQGKTTATKTVSGALPFDQFDQTLKALLNQ